MAGTFGTLKGVDSWYRHVWPTADASGAGQYTNWHNHIHSISATELPTNTWTRYAENEWYLFNGETSQGTNGEEMVEIFRHYGGWREDHILTDSSTSPSGYTLDGSIGWAFKNSGSNRTLIRRFRKEYNGTSGYGYAQISGILTITTTGVVKRIKLRATNSTNLAGGVMSCSNSSTGIFCFVENGHDTNTSSTSVGCDDPSDGSYRNFSWSSISGSGSGLTTHMQISSIAGSGGNPNNMRVQYPGTWFNSGGGDFGEGGLYVSGGSGYAVGDVLSPVTSCGSFSTSTSSLFEVTEIGSYSTSSVQQNYYERTDHRCANSDLDGVDGWQYDSFQFYAPNVVTGCSDPTANNYSEYANSGDTSTCTYVSAPSISSLTVDNTSPVPGEEFNVSWTIDDGGGTITSLTLKKYSITSVVGTTETLLNTYTLTTSDTSYTTSFAVGTGYQTTHRYRLTVVNSEGSDETFVDVTSSANAPTISNLTTDNSSPLPGEEFTLSWDVDDGLAAITDVTVTNTTTGLSYPLETDATEATFSFPSDVTYQTSWTFEVEVTNGAGSDTEEITVTSSANAPSINNLTSSLSNPVPTQEFTLSWDVSPNGSPVTDVRVFNLTQNTTDILDIEDTSATYSFPSGQPDGTEWTYRVRVTNAAGYTDAEITVTSGLATSAEFSASPSTIISGTGVVLDWAVVGSYDSLSISSAGSNPSAVGNITVYPLVTTTYILEVAGPLVENGSLTIEREVVVYQSAVINSFGFNKSLITAATDLSVTLSWNITGDVDTVNISPALPGYSTSTNFAKSDSKTFNYPLTTTQYTISAYGNGVAGSGAVTSTAQVTVNFGLEDDVTVGPGESSSVTIPKRALDVVVQLAAAKGGNGGSDSGGGGGGGGKGRKGTFELNSPQEEEYTLVISAGGNGGNGGSGGGCCGGGGGGGFPSGGNGGNTGPNGWSGGGAGGGGATQLAGSGGPFGTAKVLAVAGGGGGGGGGSWDTGTAGGGGNGKNWLVWSNDDGTMFSNLNPGNGGGANGNDGGGGGGGGGGVGPGGGGGGSGNDKSSKSSGGGGGGSYYQAGVFADITNTGTNNGQGYASVSFIYGDWIPDQFSITPQNPLTYNSGTEGPSPGETVISDYFSITGINLPIEVTASEGATLQKSGQTTWSSTLVVVDGDDVRVRYTTPTSGGIADAGYAVTYDIVVSAGLLDEEPNDVVSATWQITTRDPDITPDSFGWTNSTQNTPLNNQNIESETIVITGFEVPLEITSNQDIEVMINNDGIWRSLN